MGRKQPILSETAGKQSPSGQGCCTESSGRVEEVREFANDTCWGHPVWVLGIKKSELRVGKELATNENSLLKMIKTFKMATSAH